MNRPLSKKQYTNIERTQQKQITFVQRRPNGFDVGPTLYKCYPNVFCLLGRYIFYGARDRYAAVDAAGRDDHNDVLIYIISHQMAVISKALQLIRILCIAYSAF